MGGGLGSYEKINSSFSEEQSRFLIIRGLIANHCGGVGSCVSKEMWVPCLFPECSWGL